MKVSMLLPIAALNDLKRIDPSFYWPRPSPFGAIEITLWYGQKTRRIHYARMVFDIDGRRVSASLR
jgi:hypothetical protein